MARMPRFTRVDHDHDPIRGMPRLCELEHGRCTGRLGSMIVLGSGGNVRNLVVVVALVLVRLTLALRLGLADLQLTEDAGIGAARCLYLAPVLGLPVHGDVVGKPDGNPMAAQPIPADDRLVDADGAGRLKGRRPVLVDGRHKVVDQLPAERLIGHAGRTGGALLAEPAK